MHDPADLRRVQRVEDNANAGWEGRSRRLAGTFGIIGDRVAPGCAQGANSALTT
jgi:hypothetical protein